MECDIRLKRNFDFSLKLKVYFTPQIDSRLSPRPQSQSNSALDNAELGLDPKLVQSSFHDKHRIVNVNVAELFVIRWKIIC